MKKSLFIVILMIFVMLDFNFAVPDEKDACTTITVGKLASFDGSVITTHTCDSTKGRTWLDIVSAMRHKPGSMRKTYLYTHLTVSPDDLSKQEQTGEIPQPPITHKYLNTTLPCINEYQVAVGESTFIEKEMMKSENGIIDYYELNRLMLERSKTAREAIKVADEVTKEFGYIDGGECFTIADPNEVWHLEILGPGEGKKGAVWAAQRVPDDHVSVNANGARIREVDLSKPDYFMASENYITRAIELGLYDPNSGEDFEFCYVYSYRYFMSTRRREWRVFSLLDPELDLDPYGEVFPFSIKPETKVTPQKIMEIYRDTYEDTPYDMTKYIIAPEMDEYYNFTGKYVKSPFANPFMPYDMMPLFKVNGGWDHMGERCIARHYCIYATIIQARNWLPNEIGGLVWFGYGNPAMTSYAPIYIGIEKVPDSFKISGRLGFNRDCSWWAFNRVSDLSAQKWGHMRYDVEKVRKKFEEDSFQLQKEVEQEALDLYKKNPKKARKYLTEKCNEFMNKLVAAYWKLGDDLWTKYTGKF